LLPVCSFIGMPPYQVSEDRHAVHTSLYPTGLK
jgi:hypothetical protein